jgi:hypothetical protein
MKKLLLPLMALFLILACNREDDLDNTKATAHSFEFNAHTSGAIAGKETLPPYTLTVQLIGKDGKVLDSKIFSSSIAEHFNYKLTATTGEVTIKVSISPITIVCKDISFIPINTVTGEVGKIIEIVQLPATGVLTATYNTDTKTVVPTVPVQSHILNPDFGDKVSLMTHVQTVDNTLTEKGYRTFTFDTTGKVISSRGYKTDSQTRDENSVVIYNDAGKVVELRNTDAAGKVTIDVIQYEGDNIISTTNELEKRYEIFRYNADGKIVESTKRDNYNGNSYLRNHLFTYYANDSIRVKASDQDIADILVLNANINPLAKTIPAPFLKILSTDDDMGGFNVTNSHKEGKHDAMFDVKYEHLKDAKGRIIKQTKTFKRNEKISSTNPNMVLKTFVEVTEFQFMAK